MAPILSFLQLELSTRRPLALRQINLDFFTFFPSCVAAKLEITNPLSLLRTSLNKVACRRGGHKRAVFCTSYSVRRCVRVRESCNPPGHKISTHDLLSHNFSAAKYYGVWSESSSRIQNSLSPVRMIRLPVTAAIPY